MAEQQPPIDDNAADQLGERSAELVEKQCPAVTSEIKIDRRTPDFDRANFVRHACTVALVASYIIGFTSMAISLVLHDKLDLDYMAYNGTNGWGYTVSFESRYSRELLNLTLSAMVTICTEGIGYIHGTSLRWALHRSGRLHYSSNLRLFANEHTSVPNTWYVNALSSVGLIASYAGASLALLDGGDGGFGGYIVIVSGPSLLFLGLGLLLQAFISTWCLFDKTSDILTWSSNPLTVAKACCHGEEGLRRRPGRCLLSAMRSRDATIPLPSRPESIQPSLRATDPSTRHIIRLILILLPLSSFWAVMASLLRDRIGLIGDTAAISLPRTIDAGLITGLLLVVVFQSILTLGLHSIELLVNRARDEFCWRYAAVSRSSKSRPRSRRCGAKKAYNSIASALTSWQSLFLYTLKPLSHWIFGNSVGFSIENGSAYIIFGPFYVIGLLGCSICLLLFALFLSCRCPRGQIPSAWGHIQTLIDLIDDWGDGNVNELSWGDKGVNEDGRRHAGTSTDFSTLGEIDMNALYS